MEQQGSEEMLQLTGELYQVVDAVADKVYADLFTPKAISIMASRGKTVREVGPKSLQCDVASQSLIRETKNKDAHGFEFNIDATPQWGEPGVGGHMVVTAEKETKKFMVDMTYQQFLDDDADTKDLPTFAIIGIDKAKALIQGLRQHQMPDEVIPIYLEIYFPQMPEIESLKQMQSKIADARKQERDLSEATAQITESLDKILT